jgi:hypothetical protein
MSQKLIIEPNKFASEYPDRPFVVGHNLCEHPLFQVERMLELLKILPDHKISYFTGKVGVNEDKRKAPPTGLTAEETIRQIENAESWLVLKNVELDPEYRQLVEDCLNEVAPLAKPISPGVTQYEGWIFLTSPGSLTPYHLDPEHNFLLQIRGEKQLYVFDASDRDILSEEEIESYYAQFGVVGKLEFDESYQKKAYSFVMKPGEGVFVPVNAPHWLKVNNDVSISFSITYYSEDVYRRARLFRFNSQLRKLGLKPSPYGKSPWRDSIKDSFVSSVLNAKRLLGMKAPKRNY